MEKLLNGIRNVLKVLCCLVITFMCVIVFIQVIKLGIEIKESKVCGGGARSRLWLTILANVLNMRLRIPENEQGPSIGSAILAMVCCGVYADAAQACAQMEEAADFIEPVPSIAARYDEQYKKYSLLYPAMKPVFRAISQ